MTKSPQELYDDMMITKQRQTKFGGAMWDVMTILMNGDDEEFIVDFVKRMPCKYCIEPFFNKKKELNIEFNKDVETNRRNLWKIRCPLNINNHYETKWKDTDEEYEKYLKFLILDK